MRFLPVFMDVTSGPVALVGASEHATNKLRLLLAAHATVRWFPGHTDVADENMVSVIIHSEPTGADVLIAGTKIGTTPFESKLKRGTKIAQLTVQKDGYAPFNTKIDLGGEYENRKIKLTKLEDLPKGGETATPEKGGEESTLKEAASRLGHVQPEDFDRWVRPEEMIRPGTTLEGG